MLHCWSWGKLAQWANLPLGNCADSTQQEFSTLRLVSSEIKYAKNTDTFRIATYYLWGHMKTLVYETKVDSRAALPRRIFAAADHIRNHPHNISSATESLLIRAENWVATGGGHLEQVL